MALISFFFSFILVSFFSLISYRKAKKKGLNPFFWLILGALFSFLPYFILFFIPNRTQQKWFFLNQENQEEGPWSLEAIKEKFEKGELNKTAFIWSKESSDKKKVEEIEFLLKK